MIGGVGVPSPAHKTRDLQDSGSGVTFGIQIRAHNAGVALRYSLLGTGKTTISDATS